MRPSSALFSLFKMWLGEEERLSTMVDSSEFLVSEASTSLSACVYSSWERIEITLEYDDRTYQVRAPWAGGSRSQQPGR